MKTNLEQQLTKLSEELDNQVEIDDEIKKDYIRIKCKLENTYKNECKGASIRSRTKWLEHGERNTKYFMSLEKRNGEKKNILKLRKGKKIISKQDEILHEVVSFYEELYTSKKITKREVQRYYESSAVNKLNEEDKKLCEGLLNSAECRKAAFKMPKNKAPGGDGLPIEFYQEFWDDIEPVLVNALNENFYNKSMSDTQRQGIITLIYKKGDIESLNNWRPITLLNYDYKIMAAALANRLHKVISSIIHENQVGYVKKRMSGFNIRLTQDIFEYMHRKKKKGAVMTIDFRQAFDTIEFEFIEECLNNFNFGGDFCNWIKLMYTDVNSSVLINGWKTKTFEIGRGIRQGCPLSAMLFILAVEVLTDRIRKNDRIKGVIFGENEKQKELKVLQYILYMLMTPQCFLERSCLCIIV